VAGPGFDIQRCSLHLSEAIRRLTRFCAFLTGSDWQGGTWLKRTPSNAIRRRPSVGERVAGGLGAGESPGSVGALRGPPLECAKPRRGAGVQAIVAPYTVATGTRSSTEESAGRPRLKIRVGSARGGFGLCGEDRRPGNLERPRWRHGAAYRPHRALLTHPGACLAHPLAAEHRGRPWLPASIDGRRSEPGWAGAGFSRLEGQAAGIQRLEAASTHHLRASHDLQEIISDRRLQD